uniref:Uncharacterized protein n=1 Tax=Panagrellus redivivus TaxID=6233 RepID=A0A7E4VCA3_PANRE
MQLFPVLLFIAILQPSVGFGFPYGSVQKWFISVRGYFLCGGRPIDVRGEVYRSGIYPNDWNYVQKAYNVYLPLGFVNETFEIENPYNDAQPPQIAFYLEKGSCGCPAEYQFKSEFSPIRTVNTNLTFSLKTPWEIGHVEVKRC